MEDLQWILDEEIELVQWKETVRQMETIRPLIDKADVIAAVLPLELMAELIKVSGGKMVLQSVAERIPTGRMRLSIEGGEEPEFAFRHRYWQQIIGIDLKVRKFDRENEDKRLKNNAIVKRV